MLQIEKLSKFYRTRRGIVRAVQDVSLRVEAGEFLAVQGPSGCGKTTLLLAAGGLLGPSEGSVRVAGEDLYAMSPERRARFRAANIGFVFQQFHLVPYLSVTENVMSPALAANVPDAARRAEALVEHFGLAHRAAHLPSELSTGERQRTALARALLARPKLLLADEPTGNLDAENGQAALGYLRDFASQGGAVLLVTHDMRAADYAGRVMRLGPPARASAAVAGGGA